MRNKIIRLALMAGAAALVLVISLAGSGKSLFAQRGGARPTGDKAGGIMDMAARFGGGGGAGGMGGFGLDPEKLFDLVAKGNDTVVIGQAGMLKGPLEKYAQEIGNTSGVLTRDQFTGFAQTLMNKVQTALSSGTNLADLAKNWRESQGFSFTNGDFGNGGGLSTLDLEELFKKPTVYRAGKLPNELPGWFVEYDRDKDGQVGLYEWRQSSKSIAEFQVMDRNEDGLLTAEEVLWFLKKTNPTSGDKVASASAAQPQQRKQTPAVNNKSFGENGGMGRGKMGGGNFDLSKLQELGGGNFDFSNFDFSNFDISNFQGLGGGKKGGGFGNWGGKGQ